ncbi:MAG: hypothetical protein ACOC6O_00520 [Chloroflexota bacterium]
MLVITAEQTGGRRAIKNLGSITGRRDGYDDYRYEEALQRMMRQAEKWTANGIVGVQFVNLVDATGLLIH